MSDKRLFLKVKLKSLAAESRIIRQEELRHRTSLPDHLPEEILSRLQKTNEMREQLHLHRVQDVRGEARATHLAYGFLKGLKYRQIEKHTREEVLEDKHLLSRVITMVGKYGPKSPDAAVKGLIEAWVKE